MADMAQPYDKLAAHYDQIFENWEESIVRQATALSRILHNECGHRLPIRVLDCACGIGTQSIGLALKGFDIEGCDLSPGAIQRARLEASNRGLSVPFAVANMLQLSSIPRSCFDAVICIDNALAHLESDGQLLQAAQQAYGKLRVGGSFIGSIRDYDRLVIERPTMQGPSFFSDNGRRRIVFQIWDWLDERRYRFHLYITRSTESEWQTVHFSSTYRTVLRSELDDILNRAGFTNVRWLLPADSGFYQPIFVANRRG
jgi:glycine/sarcosine N-methyltransferase